MITTLYLVRHAQALPLPTVSEPEWQLSPTGVEQARVLARVLQPLNISCAYTSPFRRCRETLRPFAEATGLPLLVHDGLRERRISSGWVGDYREIWQRSWLDFSFVPPGGESSLECRTRIANAVTSLVCQHPGETIVVCSHGNSVGLLLTTVDASFGLAEASALRTPELFRLTADGKSLAWDRSFCPGTQFDGIATDFRLTPGIVA